MYTVKQILNGKGRAVWSISPQESVYEALRRMSELDIGALLVMDGERLIGIFSERDYARKIILLGRSSKETPVSAIMTGQVYTIQPEHTTDECMALMTERRIRHLPVVSSGQVVGVISIGDIVKAVISNQEFTITQLENYITGER